MHHLLSDIHQQNCFLIAVIGTEAYIKSKLHISKHHFLPYLLVANFIKFKVHNVVKRVTRKIERFGLTPLNYYYLYANLNHQLDLKPKLAHKMSRMHIEKVKRRLSFLNKTLYIERALISFLIKVLNF